MKLFAAALLAVYVSAYTTFKPSTDNDCFKDQDAVYVEDCLDLYYDSCQQFKIDPLGTCNVMVNGNSELDYYSSEIVVYFWPYVEVPKGMTYEEYASG